METQYIEDEEDIIYIHIPKLTERQYNEVIDSVKEFMEIRWPDFAQNRFTT